MSTHAPQVGRDGVTFYLVPRVDDEGNVQMKKVASMTEAQGAEPLEDAASQASDAPDEQ